MKRNIINFIYQINNINNVYEKIITFLKNVPSAIRIQYKEIRNSLKKSFKHFRIKNKTRIKSFGKWMTTVDIDWMFVFIASYILTHEYSLLHRLGFSIGVTHVYKYLIIEKIKQLIVVNKRT